MNYQEENDKAEFWGGAVAGGCILFVIVASVVFVLCAFIFFRD